MKWFFLFLFLVCGIAYAKDISAPPPLPTEPVLEQHYLQELYENFNRLERTTQNPNGERLGTRGDILWYQTNYLDDIYLAINIDGLYHWWAIKFTDQL